MLVGSFWNLPYPMTYPYMICHSLLGTVTDKFQISKTHLKIVKINGKKKIAKKIGKLERKKILAIKNNFRVT